MPGIYTTNFTGSQLIGPAPLYVVFEDLSSATPSDPPTSWLWDFGDGNTSTDQYPLHIYLVEGVYDVTLTPSLPYTPLTLTAFITVGQPPVFTGQKVKVQGGNLSYSTTDPDTLLKFNVDGVVTVSNEIAVGSDPMSGGIISTPIDTDLLISAGGAIQIQQNPTGSLLLNNVKWPATSISPGMFIGASSLNTLTYFPLVMSALSDINIGVPVVGDVLTFDGVKWVNTAGYSTLALTDLTDTNIVSPNIGDVLTFDGVKWVSSPVPPPGPTTLAALTDTNIASPVVGDFLYFDGTKWVNAQLPPVVVPGWDAPAATAGWDPI